MKQLKDKEHTLAIIKLTKVRECFKEKNGQSFKDKLICVRIDKPIVRVSTCFDDNRKGHRELIKFLKEELYLK